ncbi:MAG: hypothetical protein AAFV07_13525 [Bacteroidota bacterium]
MKLIFCVHVAVTGLMTGIIWFVQMVHYPLFAAVGALAFAQYESLHRTATSLLVGPLMLVELGTGVLLLFGKPAGLPVWVPWTGLVLLGCIWGSTFFIQVPLHDQLLNGQEGIAIRRLVSSNWIRTIAWSLRLGVLMWGIWYIFPSR